MSSGEVDIDAFRWQLKLLADNFNVLPLSCAVEQLYKGTLPPRSLCITFDDGYADNAEVALPVLQKFGFTATFFIATGFLDGGRMWNDTVIEAIRRIHGNTLDLSAKKLGIHKLESLDDRRCSARRIIGDIKHRPQDERQELADWVASHSPVGLPDDLMMRSEQVKILHDAGMEIGAHTVTHPILACLSPKAARQEIAGGKEQLEAIIGDKVRSFAYPNGKLGQDYRSEHVEMVKQLGFDSAVSTDWGVSTAQTDRWQLRRFTPWDRTPARFMARLLKNYLHKE